MSDEASDEECPSRCARPFIPPSAPNHRSKRSRDSGYGSLGKPSPILTRYSPRTASWKGSGPAPHIFRPEVVQEIVGQICRLVDGYEPDETEFEVSCQECQRVFEFLDSDPKLEQFVDTKLRYDYSPETGYLGIRMPSQTHGVTGEFLQAIGQQYIDTVKAAKDPTIRELAANLKISTWQSFKKKLDLATDNESLSEMEHFEDSEDDTYVHPPEPRPKRALCPTQKQKEIELAKQSFTSNGSSFSSDSEHGKVKRSYEPDISIIWQKGIERIPSVAIEVAKTQKLFNLKRKMRRSFQYFGFSTLLAVDIDCEAGARYEGKDLEPGATYMYLWRRRMVKERHGGPATAKVQTVIFKKLLHGGPEHTARYRQPTVETLSANMMLPQLSAARTEEERRILLREALSIGPMSIPIQDLRSAIIQGEGIEQTPIYQASVSDEQLKYDALEDEEEEKWRAKRRRLD